LLPRSHRRRCRRLWRNLPRESESLFIPPRAIPQHGLRFDVVQEDDSLDLHFGVRPHLHARRSAEAFIIVAQVAGVVWTKRNRFDTDETQRKPSSALLSRSRARSRAL
jgi:hypothetical protein